MIIKDSVEFYNFITSLGCEDLLVSSHEILDEGGAIFTFTQNKVIVEGYDDSHIIETYCKDITNLEDRTYREGVLFNV